MLNRSFIRQACWLFLGLIGLSLIAGGIGYWIAGPEYRGSMSSAASVPTPRLARALLELRVNKLCPKAGGGPFTGLMFEQTTTGDLIAEVPVQDGIIHGIARGWHESGQLEVQEPFVDGLSHGLRTRWHPNGRKRSTATIRAGVLHGPFTEWHDNGQIAVQMEMVDGRGEGLVESWNPDGSLKSRVTLQAGVPVATDFYTIKNTQSDER